MDLREAVPWLRGRRRGGTTAHGPRGLGEDAKQRLCGAALNVTEAAGGLVGGFRGLLWDFYGIVMGF